MTGYAAPLQEMLFLLEEVAGLREIAALPGFGEVTPELAAEILAEGDRFAGEVLAPLNRIGDQQGSRLENGVARTPQGFAAAYDRFVAAGWNGVVAEPGYGGQGLPLALGTALQEMWHAANMAFALCPMLTQAAIHCLQRYGSPQQRSIYLPKLVSGAWTGTMNLTEPQAGSDVGAVRTRAVPDGECYRITGTKIFITYGDHDLAENIVHMVLARTPKAPAGTKGLSLFLVPKILVNADGTLDGRNDLRCVSLETKMGIHASPTAVMAYGDNDGAAGYLIGQENRGIEYMFAMMNNARLGVGVEGLGIAERAYQQARAFARSRVQGRPVGRHAGAGAPIIEHPDVRRMLMTMRATLAAMRGLVYITAAAVDAAEHHLDPAEQERQQTRADLLIPVVKAWCTDRAFEIASLALQVHGGTGYIEETGAAQHLRDARIASIYEGTNGIQANDLVGRKLIRDGGAGLRLFLTELRATAAALAAVADEEARRVGAALADGAEALSRASDWLLEAHRRDPAVALAGASPYLALFGTVAGGWALARAAAAALRRLAHAADGESDGFYQAEVRLARFYAENLAPHAGALASAVMCGGPSTLALPSDQF